MRLISYRRARHHPGLTVVMGENRLTAFRLVHWETKCATERSSYMARQQGGLFIWIHDDKKNCLRKDHWTKGRESNLDHIPGETSRPCRLPWQLLLQRHVCLSAVADNVMDFCNAFATCYSLCVGVCCDYNGRIFTSAHYWIWNIS